jgi:hypothetical protein
MDPEEAKNIAKCIVQQLADAGFDITHQESSRQIEDAQ